MSPRKLLLLQIYLYLICLVTAITFLIVVGNGLWGVVGMVLPRLTISQDDYKTISSFEHYKNSRARLDRPQEISKTGQIDETELRLRWEEEKLLVLDSERRIGLREFIRMWVWIVLVVPIYLFHWRAARRLKDETETPVARVTG